MFDAAASIPMFSDARKGIPRMTLLLARGVMMNFDGWVLSHCFDGILTLATTAVLAVTGRGLIAWWIRIG